MKNSIKIVVLLSIFFISNLEANGFPKEYYKLHITKQKEYFFNYFAKRIEKENKKILEDREFILSLNGKKDLNPNSKEYKRLEKLKNKYKIKNIYDYEKFIYRVDIIPPSLALAQAAIESGWGKSRFFKEANNIFGHWTYDEKRGIVPQRREEGKKHLIRVFPTLQDSIIAYMRNLNSTNAYGDFRVRRKEQRTNDKLVDGYSLSETMENYSGIGHKYVEILQSIIRKNKLKELDIKFYKQINQTKKDKDELHSTHKI